MIKVKVYNIKVEDINKSDSNTKDTYPMVEYQFYGFLMDEIQLVNEQNARLKAEVERLTAMADENAHLHKGIYSLSLNVVQLKDEVKRLRKAGDEVIHEWSSGHGTDVENFTKALWLWTVAQKNKPSV